MYQLGQKYNGLDRKETWKRGKWKIITDRNWCGQFSRSIYCYGWILGSPHQPETKAKSKQRKHTTSPAPGLCLHLGRWCL